MSTLPTPSLSVTDVRVRYNFSSGEILQEFRLTESVVAQLNDTELETLFDAMDAGVLAHITDPGQIQRVVEYSFSGSANTNTVIRVS